MTGPYGIRSRASGSVHDMLLGQQENADQSSFVRRHWVFLVALALGTVLRLVVLIAYRPILLLQSDGYVYLQKSLDMEPAQLRPIFYSVFLRPFVELGELSLVAVVQHLLGLLMAVLIYRCLVGLGAGEALGAAATLPVLLDGYQLNIEHYVLSETLFQALLLGGVMLLVRTDRSGPTAAALAGSLLACAALTRYVGVLAIAIGILYLVLRRRSAITVVAFVAAASVPLLLYASWFQSMFGEFTLTNRSGHFLYGRVAPIAECDWDVPETQRVLCDPRPPERRPGHNYYVFSDDSPIHSVEVPRGETLDDVLSAFAWGVIRHEPVRYTSRVGGDILHALSPVRYSGAQDAELGLWRFPVRLVGMEDRAFLVRRYQASPPPEVDPTNFRIMEGPARFLRTYQSAIYTYGPLFGLFALVGLAGGWRDRRGSVGSSALAFSVVGLATTLFPFFTINFDYRFLTPAIPLLPLGAIAGWVSWRSSSVEGDPLAQRDQDRSL